VKVLLKVIFIFPTSFSGARSGVIKYGQQTGNAAAYSCIICNGSDTLTGKPRVNTKTKKNFRDSAAQPQCEGQPSICIISTEAAIPLTLLCCIKSKTVTRWRSRHELESGRDGRC